jgi:hypothetical protein
MPKRHRARRAAAALCLALLAMTAGPPAKADTCSEETISARGEPSRFQWLAVMKARGNWRSKVRLLPELGAPYANFRRAAEQVERCISDQRTIVCTVSARPCRP